MYNSNCNKERSHRVLNFIMYGCDITKDIINIVYIVLWFHNLYTNTKEKDLVLGYKKVPINAQKIKLYKLTKDKII